VPYFDVVIGNERVRVTNVQSDDGQGGDLRDSGEFDESPAELASEVEFWTVTRGVGHTTNPPATLGAMTDGHSTNGLVMSTPKPLLPTSGVPAPYKAGTPALMCVAAQQSNDPVAGSHTTTLLDVGGDGHVQGP